MEYKYKIDKELLKEFLLSDDATKEQLAEIDKVIFVVFVKHFNSYMYMLEELAPYAITEILEKRKNYDPTFSAYNYIYTITRNSVGNKIKKSKTRDGFPRELSVPEILPYSEGTTYQEHMEVPPFMRKYLPYLLGEQDVTLLEMPAQDAVCLAAFCNSKTKVRLLKVPDWLDSPVAAKVLYNLLMQVI